MKRFFTLISLFFFCVLAQAAIKPSHICNDGMVLQQNAEVAIWGTATPGANVSLTTSWNGASYRSKTTADGRWTVYVKTPAASYKPYTITIKGDGSTVRINDVLVGEVWLASGQSNMQMPMCGFFNCPVENADRKSVV